MATKSEPQSLTVPRFARGWTSGERLELVRAALIVTAVGVVLLFAAGANRLYHQLLTPCPDSAADCRRWLRSENSGVSAEFYARWTVGREIVFLAVFCALAALLFWKAPRQPMALLAAITLVLAGGAVFPDSMAVLLESDSLLRVPATIAAAAGSIAFIAFVFLFPDGRFVPRWLRPLLAIWVVLNVISCFLPPRGLLGTESDAAFLLALIFLLIGAGAQFARFRRATSAVERQQLKWVALGLATAVVGLIVGALMLPAIPPSVIANRRRFALIGMTLTSAVLLLIPFSIALALLRYRLWEVDRLARRAAISGALIAVVTGIYASIVLGASALVPGGSSRLWPLVAAVVVALLLQPVRGRLERNVNRLFYGQRDDPYAVISSLGERLEGSLSQEDALPTIVETIAGALHLPYVAIGLMQEGRVQIAARQGEPGAETIVFPLTSGSETVGELIVSPRSAGEPFSEADRRLLADVARQAGAAVEAVRLTKELEQANRHLLSVRSEERQRLRRDLHDGLGPLLASQMLILDSARTLMPSDPALAANLLTQLRQHIQTAVDDVRRLVNSLRPAALDELGLLAAIREGTAGLQRGGLSIVVDAPAELGPLSAATETAAYRIAMEAVTNVVRHARARECRIVLSTEPDRVLRIVIRDDGVGIADDATAGVGLASMRERARALGGTLEIDSSPGNGTTITVLLPVDGRAA
jgi:signal transduction histidine kinase